MEVAYAAEAPLSTLKDEKDEALLFL